jgi:hypothetical protein
MNLIIDNDCENRNRKLTSASGEDFLSSDSSLKVENYAFGGKFLQRMKKLRRESLKAKRRAVRSSRIETENASDSYSIYTVAQSPNSNSFVDKNVGTRFDYSSVSADVLAKYLSDQLRRAAKLEGRLEHKKEIVKILHKLGFVEQADKLRRCNANVSVLVCKEGHSFNKYVDYRCHLPVCADCQETKSLRELARILPKFLQLIKDNPHLILAFMTLTLRSDKKRGLRGGCGQIKTDFAKLRGRKVWKDCIGGVGRIENTFNRMLGWHPHIHNLLLLNEYLPQKDLSAKWQAITKDSKIVDIRQVHDLKAGLVECVKYPFKLADVRSFSREQFKEMFALKGERLGVSFGECFGLDVDDDIGAALETEHTDFVEQTKKFAIGDACPFCQSKLDLIDFSADCYAKFLLSVPIESHSRGKPKLINPL